jgi:hypothetical protein
MLVMVSRWSASGPLVAGGVGALVAAGAALVGIGSGGVGSGFSTTVLFFAQLKAQVTMKARVAVSEMGTDNLFIFMVAARFNPSRNK